MELEYERSSRERRAREVCRTPPVASDEMVVPDQMVASADDADAWPRGLRDPGRADRRRTHSQSEHEPGVAVRTRRGRPLWGLAGAVLSQDQTQPLPSSLGAEVDQLIDDAMKLRPDLASRVATLKSGEASVQRAKAEFYPVLGVTVNYGENLWQYTFSGPPAITSGTPQYEALLTSARPPADVSLSS